MAQKESEWISCKTKPTIRGLYKRRHRGMEGWQMWHGSYWGFWCVRRDSAYAAELDFLGKSRYQSGHWKGLIEE